VARHFDDAFFALHTALGVFEGDDAGAAAVYASECALHVPWSCVRRRTPRLVPDAVVASPEYRDELAAQGELLAAITAIPRPLDERAAAARALALRHPLRPDG
jgi:hypothetical protein